MTAATYDIGVIGGGVGGSALAKVMAENGARVLLLEKEARFRDRVRGEWLASWGVWEAKELGVHDAVMAAGGNELRWWDAYKGRERIEHRDLSQTTTQRLSSIAVYHPRLQESLLQAAEAAGANVRRGARAVGVRIDGLPTVVAAMDGRGVEVSCRLVVGSDGRPSGTRAWGGFEVERDPDQDMVCGVLFDAMPLPTDAAHVWNISHLGITAVHFPQGGGRVRAYFVHPSGNDYRLSGGASVPRFIEESVRAGVPPEYYAEVTPSGPLATFSGAANWVERPHRNGVVLIGDAAWTSDPLWGQGLSLALRDARVLRDQLLKYDDWRLAANAYVDEFRRYRLTNYKAETWMFQIAHETGPDADARRARVIPKWKELGRPEAFDVLYSGPNRELDEADRRRFFAE